MNRPNLLSLAAAAVLLSIASSEALAQYAPQYGPPEYCPPQQYGGPPQQYGGPPQQYGGPALFQMPQSHCQSHYQPPTIDHYVEKAPPLWDQNRPIEHFLHEVTSRSWMRLEFMQWSFQDPSGGVIGSAVSGLQYVPPNQSLEGVDVPIDINDNLNGGNSVGQTLFPQSSSLNLIDTPGLRGTLGVAMNGGDLELSFFGFQQKSDVLAYNNIAGARTINAAVVAAAGGAATGVAIDPAIGTTINPNYAIPLLTDGVVTDVAGLNALIFDDTFQARFSSQLWGTELTFLTDRYVPGEGFGFQWLGGIRYTNLDETYSIHGTYDGGLAVADHTTDINSAVINNFYGPEGGARLSYVTRWFTLSATPRVMLGLNDYTSTVSSNPLGTGSTSYRRQTTDFGSITQLNLAAEVHLNSKFSVYGGYDFMWIPRVSRPNENIYYNSTSTATGFAPDIRQNVNLSTFSANGFSLGAVFRY